MPIAKYRSADADFRGAFGNRGFEIRRHAHGQRIDRQARRAAALEAPAQRAKLRTLPRDIRGRRRNAHDAAQAQARLLREPVRLLGR